MPNNPGKVIAGMSGGVDSAVAALLLKKKGYDVTGVTLRTWEADSKEVSRCCETDDAERSARHMGIPYYVLNSSRDFTEKVKKPFIDSYLSGITPNPCIECNRSVKWERMLYYAEVFGADYIATGHYASVKRLENGRYTLKRALYAEKDQTYMLCLLTQEQLSRTIFPLSDLSKEEVRRIAAEEGLSIANKPDSQEICFVPDKDYAGFIERNISSPLPGEGDFVDTEGHVIGRHKGIHHYTVGQRRGLGLPLGYPAFVTRICPENNTVVVGDEASLMERSVFVSSLNFMGIKPLDPGDRIRGYAKIRYRQEAKSATAVMTDENTLRIDFDEPLRAGAPGQGAVLYDEEGCVLLGGVIKAG